MEKKAIITGASRGIGEAISRALIEEGWRVVGLARDFRKSSIHDDRFEQVKIDLGDLKNLPARLKQLSKEHPDIDALICNAARLEFGGLEEFSFDAIRASIDMNLTSHIFMARAFVPLMKARGGGDVVLMGSEAALRGSAKGTLYCAAKFGLRGFAQALREECASSGVRVTVINPGMVRTGVFEKLGFEPGEEPENAIEPADIAEAVKLALAARRGTNFDEINLTPLKKVVRFKRGG